MSARPFPLDPVFYTRDQVGLDGVEMFAYRARQFRKRRTYFGTRYLRGEIIARSRITV